MPNFKITVKYPHKPRQKKTKMLQLEKESWNQQKEAELTKINQFVNQKNNQLAGIKTTIDYYETSGKKLSDEILKVANMSYKHGEIDCGCLLIGNQLFVPFLSRQKR